jgi:predicted enzyme involved in methoxymalonyl-ACP biosynthesis
MWLDSWLMSCRVLGRGVEKAILAVVRSECLKMGFSRLIGEYRPSGKNGMVAEHYRSLGFSQIESRDGTHTLWSLDLEGWRHEIGHPFAFTPPI